MRVAFGQGFERGTVGRHRASLPRGEFRLRFQNEAECRRVFHGLDVDAHRFQRGAIGAGGGIERAFHVANPIAGQTQGFMDLALRGAFVCHGRGDLGLGVPLAPWEAALGATIEVPTLGGAVNLKIPPATAAGRKLRLAKRGLPRPGGGEGDLYAIVQIVNPTVLGERERDLFRQLAEASHFNPRGHFTGGGHG